MKVLHVDTAAGWRGGQNQVLLSALGMAARGHEVAVACRAGGILEGRAQSAGLDVYAFPFRGDWSPSAALGLARLARRVRPDVVHAHDPARPRRRARGGSAARGQPPRRLRGQGPRLALEVRALRTGHRGQRGGGGGAAPRRRRARPGAGGVRGRARPPAGPRRTGHAGGARRADDGAGRRERRRAHRPQGPPDAALRGGRRRRARAGGPLRDRGRRGAQGRAPRAGGRARAAGPRGLRRASARISTG